MQDQVTGQTHQERGTFRGWMTPILLSLFIVPLPGLGARAVPFLLVVWLLTDRRLRLHAGEMLLYSGLVVLGLVMAMFQQDKIGFMLGLLLAILITRLLEVIPRSWSLRPALWLHCAAAGLSFATLLGLGYDLMPQILYGESRHGIHVNAFLQFRISGLYLEPSTFGLHMLLLSIWADHAHPGKRGVSMMFAGLALLTFSSITILAAFKLILDQRHLLRSKAGVFLLPLVVSGGGVVLVSFYLFFSDKLRLYQAQGLETSKRFEALFFTLEQIAVNDFNFLQGHDATTLQAFVVYDLGPVISTSLILGLPGFLLVVAFCARMRFSLLNIAIIMATKASINNPLLWIGTRRFAVPHDGRD